MKKIFRVCIALLLCFSLVTPAFALDGIWHNPYGIDDLYDHEPTEIYPLTPIAGEMIYGNTAQKRCGIKASVVKYRHG